MLATMMVVVEIKRMQMSEVPIVDNQLGFCLIIYLGTAVSNLLGYPYIKNIGVKPSVI